MLRALIYGQPADDIEYRHAPDGSLFDLDVHDCRPDVC
jgi:hypothetical protein